MRDKDPFHRYGHIYGHLDRSQTLLACDSAQVMPCRIKSGADNNLMTEKIQSNLSGHFHMNSFMNGVYDIYPKFRLICFSRQEYDKKIHSKFKILGGNCVCDILDDD